MEHKKYLYPMEHKKFLYPREHKKFLYPMEHNKCLYPMEHNMHMNMYTIWICIQWNTRNLPSENFMKILLQQICFIISSSFYFSDFHRNIYCKHRSLEKQLIVFWGNTLYVKYSHQNIVVSVVSYSDKKKFPQINPNTFRKRLSKICWHYEVAIAWSFLRP